MAQLVRDERIVLWDRRRGLTYDDAGVRAKWGVPPTSIPDWLAVVGDSSDGYPGHPGLGCEGRGGGAVGVRPSRGHPGTASAWEVPGVGGGRAMTWRHRCATTWDEALLYRDLARLRTAEDGVPIRQKRSRRAALGRRPAGHLGSVLRGMGSGAAPDPTAPLAGRELAARERALCGYLTRSRSVP